MKPILISILMIFVSKGFSQKNSFPNPSYHVKMNNLSYHFEILDEKEKKISHFDPSKHYFWYKSQLILQTQGGGSGSLLHGPFTCYHPNKQLESSGQFREGLKDGIWRYWTDRGNLVKQESWSKGILKGNQLYYDSLGTVNRKVKYGWLFTRIQTKDSLYRSRNDKSKLTLIDSVGKTFSIQRIKNGKLHGTQILRDNTGKLVKTKYKNGQPLHQKPQNNEPDSSESKQPSKLKSWFKGHRDKSQSGSELNSKDSRKEKQKNKLFSKKQKV